MLVLLTSVVGVLVSPGAGLPIILKDVAFAAPTVVAAHGVDTDVCTQSGVAAGTFVNIWFGSNAIEQFQHSHAPAPLLT